MTPMYTKKSLRADPDDVEARLEDADQDGTDEGTDHGAPAAGEGGSADDTGAHGVEDVVDAGVARVQAAVLDRVDDPDEPGKERADHEAQDLHAPDRHAGLGGTQQVAARRDDTNAETRSPQHELDDQRDERRPR